MALMLDTEDVEIPGDDWDGRALFDADLCDWGDNRGPILTINVPTFFQAASGAYDGDGVLVVPIRDVLEEYLRDFKSTDGGNGIEAFAVWLHDYADRLREAATSAVTAIDSFDG